MLRFLLLALFCFTAALLPAQLGSWSHRMPVQLTEEKGQNLGGFPVLVIVDTQTPIAAGQMRADGNDIRIADSCGTTFLHHWIESGINTDSTRIWFRIPGLSPNDSVTWYLYHGNPTAPADTFFNGVFQTAYFSQGNDTLGGPIAFQSFEVRSGDTIFIEETLELTLFTRRFRCDGVVMGTGKGHQPPGLGMSGNGNGGGGTSFNAGAGGGGYGGAGGTGGYDFADTPGQGGNAYGTDYGPDIDPGSAGRSSSNRLGGAGGGSFAVYGEALDVAGEVWCNGLPGEQSASARGAGGGAGGGILLTGKYLTLTGLLAVNGGNGTFGTSASNDDGGGGGGGRIKLFWEDELWDLGQLSALGGLGGPNGSQSSGEDGGPGAVRDSSKAYPTVHFQVGPSMSTPLPPHPELIPIPHPICPGEPVSFSLPSGYSHYTFFQNGTAMQDSNLTDWNAGVLPDGTTVIAEATYGVCTVKDTLVVQAATTPPIAITASDSSACLGDTVILDAGYGWTAVLWNTGDTTRTKEVSFSGFFSVEVRDSNNCPVRDTYVVNLGPPPIPQITVSGLPACEGQPITLTTGAFSGYAWSNGGTSQTTVVNASDTYTVTVTAANGCENEASVPIVMDSLPTPSVTWLNDTLRTETGYATYQWLWNGSPLSGANQYFHVPGFNGGYSVVVTDGNGCEGTSDTTQVVVGLEGNEWEAALRVYPNPSRGSLQVSGEMPYPAVVWMRVSDVMGRQWGMEKWDLGSGNFKRELDLSGLPKGVYVLILEGAGEAMLRKQLKFTLE